MSGGRNHTYNPNGTLKTEILSEIDPVTGQGYIKAYFYDAFDRLVLVKKDATVLAAYSYDALGRRVTENHGTEVLDLYYSTEWQVLEERVNGVVKSQYVWSPEYIDALILRDSDLNGDGDMADTNERLYALQDPNFNVTAVVNTSGTVVERYVYTPYGEATILTAGWSTISSSTVNWVYLHQGTRFDITVGLYHNRNRDYSPTLGRWISVDPMGFAAGDPNLYRANGNSPGNYVDPLGLRFEVGMDTNMVIDADERTSDGGGGSGGGEIGSAAHPALQKPRWMDNWNRLLAGQVQSVGADDPRLGFDGMKKLTPQEKQKVNKEVQLLLDGCRFEWPHITGFFGKCYDWNDEYYKRTRGTRNRLEREMGKYFRVNQMFWKVNPPPWFHVLAVVSAAAGGHPYELWAELDPGHAAIEIKFADGTIMYLDDGNLGGDDHIFLPSDIPSYYSPWPGFPIKVKFNK